MRARVILHHLECTRIFFTQTHPATTSHLHPKATFSTDAWSTQGIQQLCIWELNVVPLSMLFWNWNLVRSRLLKMILSKLSRGFPQKNYDIKYRRFHSLCIYFCFQNPILLSFIWLFPQNNGLLKKNVTNIKDAKIIDLQFVFSKIFCKCNRFFCKLGNVHKIKIIGHTAMRNYDWALKRIAL